MERPESSSGSTLTLAGLNLASAGLLLAAAPAVGYLLTWVHLLGYANQFDIPSDLIAPQLGDVLATTFGLGLLTLIVFMSLVTFEARVLRWSRGLVGPIESRIGVLALTTSFALVLAGLSWPSGEEVAAVGVLLVILAGVLFSPIVLTRGGTLRDRLRRADARGARKETPSLVLNELQNRIGALGLALAAVVFLLGILAYDAGSYQAHTQTDFLVSDASTPEVTLAIYGDSVIMAPLDKSKRAVKPTFDIFKIGTSPLHLRVVRVGPLTLDH